MNPLAEPVADWLGDADKVADLGRRLWEGGVPADRLALYRRTLHPEILARATVWAPGRPVEIFDREHGLDLSSGFFGSPLDQVMADGEERELTRSQLVQGGWRWADLFHGMALTGLHLSALSGRAALAVATVRESGFCAADLSSLCRLARFLNAPSARGCRPTSSAPRR